jgi:hypothetical protein
MFLNETTKHVPVMITIAYYNINKYNKLITNFFLINIHDIKNEGYEYAANNM